MTHTRRAFLQSSLGAGLLAACDHALGQTAQSGESATRLVATGFRGEIVTPTSARYGEARRIFVFNPRRPALPSIIAICADEADVRRAIAFAREERLELAVRAGGHDLCAASICNGIVIDLSALQAIQVDTAARTVRFGAGVRAGALNSALTARGFAAALGCAGQVGVTGLVLGGGLGWLVGRHGAACDHLIAARLVTADGRQIEVSEREHRQLLWALRGGGGNFGVVTEMTLAIHPAPGVVQGMVALRVDRVSDFLLRYRDYLASAGDEVDLESYIFRTSGGPMAFIKACYCGAPGRAERTLAPLRRLATFAADDLAARPYTGLIDPGGAVAPLFRPEPMSRRDDDVPGLHVGSASLAMDAAAADIIADRLARASGGWTAGFGHYVHGAAARASPRHSAMRRVPGIMTTYFIANWRRPDEAEFRMAWVDETVAALSPQAGPTYVNYITSSDPAEVRRAYGGAYPRLAAIKRRYDPDNVFRRNRNIAPA